ncbi:MAG: C25 family cysteine peptidase [Chloroflexi bacterium]|nr:C25 family cysteine peptidase [Chloroflexota bacterium]
MPGHITAAGPSSLATGAIQGSLIVTGSGNDIHISAEAFARSPEARNYLRMLAVIAAPVAAADGVNTPLSPPLDVWGEWERLRAALDGPTDPVAGEAAAWAVVRLAEPTIERLRDALATGPGYHVVHFIGHGSPDGILLENSLGCEQFVPTADLVAILSGDGSRPAPALVVFNACETQPVAQAVVAGGAARAALAACQPIFDLEAKLLAERLYRRLGGGAAVGAALDEFRRTLVERLRSGELPDLGDPDTRAANVVLVGDAGLRLQAEPPAAGRPRFVLDVAPHNEPLPLSLVHGFVGRAGELVTLARWLRREGVVAFAISGAGGAGKTALALNAALRYSHRFAALAFASAKDIPDFGPLQAVQALDTALGTALAPEETGNLPCALAQRLNGDRPVLLVLDNLESVAPVRAAELARTLAGVDPRRGSRVLMTLRPYDRDPLTALARGDRLLLRDLDRPSALRLAWEEAAARHLDVTGLAPAQPLTPQAAAEVRAAQRRAWLERLPLAQAAALDELAGLAFRHPALIEKAVCTWDKLGWPRMRARLAALQGKEIADALDDFIGQMADDLAAHAPAGLALLYAALPFAGGAALPRLRFVALGADVPDDSPQTIGFEDEALTPAVAAGLLRRDRDRYDLDAPVRAYLEARRPPDPGTRRTYELRHAETFQPLVAAYDDLIASGAMTYSAPLEWANVTAVFERLTARAPADNAAAQLLIEYSRSWRNVLYNNHDPRRLAWLTAAVAAAERGGEPWEQANVLQAQGAVLAFQDRRDEALAKYEAALGLFRAVGARLGEANVLQAQGQMALAAGVIEQGMALMEAARSLYAAVGARAGLANVGIMLGRYAAARGDYAAAIQYMQPAADFGMAINHPMGPQLQAEIAGWQAQLVWQQDPAAVRDALQQAATDARASGDREALAQALAGLLQVGQRLEAWGEVAAAAEELIALGFADGDAWAALADARSNLNDEAAAAEAYAQAVALAADQAMLRRNYANSLLALGRLGEAGIQIDAAEALDPDSPYLALRRAELAKAQNDRREAARWAREALRRQPGWEEAKTVLREAEGD